MNTIIRVLSLLLMSAPINLWANANDPNTPLSTRTASTEASAGRTCQTSHFGYCPSTNNVAHKAQTGKLPLLPFSGGTDKDQKDGGSGQSDR